MLERDDPYFLNRFDEIVEAAAHRIAHNPTENGRNAVNDLYRLTFSLKHLLQALADDFGLDCAAPEYVAGHDDDFETCYESTNPALTWCSPCQVRSFLEPAHGK